MQNRDFTIVVQLLIWKPVAEVFRAFIDPEIITNFWLSKSSGTLETGKTVTWEWEMHDSATLVKAEEIIENESIKIEWGHPIPKVEIDFKVYGDHATLVVVKNYSEKLIVGDIINEIIKSTSDFTSVLDGLKAYMEHNIKLNAIEDKIPHDHL